MLKENELKELIKREEERHQYILDVKAQTGHSNFIMGLKCALNK